jgi:hypothetical protein
VRWCLCGVDKSSHKRCTVNGGLHTHKHTHTHIHTSVYTYIHTYTQTHTHTHIHTHTHTHAYIRIHTCTQTHTHTHTHTYIRTYIHTYLMCAEVISGEHRQRTTNQPMPKHLPYPPYPYVPNPYILPLCLLPISPPEQSTIYVVLHTHTKGTAHARVTNNKTETTPTHVCVYVSVCVC